MKEALGANPQPEKVKIPGEWNFLERDTEGLKVSQIDLRQRFLAISLPNRQIHEWDSKYRGEYVDYFFDAKGEAIDYRKHSDFSTTIVLRKSDTGMRFWMNEERGGLPEDYSTITVGLSETAPEVKTLEFSALDYDNYLTFLSIFAKNTFYRGLFTIDSSRIFAKDRNGNEIKSLGAVMGLIDVGGRGNNLEASDWSLKDYDKSRFLSDKQEKSNEVFFRNEKGEVVFRLNWEVEDGKLVISETYLPTQITKILCAPIIFPTGEVAKAVFSRSPYEKKRNRISGLEHLEVPWREIDKILGVSLAYSSPRSIPQENQAETTEEAL